MSEEIKKQLRKMAESQRASAASDGVFIPDGFKFTAAAAVDRIEVLEAALGAFLAAADDGWVSVEIDRAARQALAPTPKG